MRNVALLSLLLLCAPVSAKKPSDSQSFVQRVPSIEEVVRKEGFVPTPSHSDMYRPGMVLVPNAQRGYDVVFPDCIGVEPEISVMSQSNIAASLSVGVSARMVAIRGQAVGGVEKRLSFVDPEQRTIPLAKLGTTEACISGLKNAARFADLSQAILVYDVLVAQISNTICTKADSSGSVTLLAEAEAAAYSECVQESDSQVPLGFKFVPLSQVIAVSSSGVLQLPAVVPRIPEAASGDVDFGLPMGPGGIDDAQFEEQECIRIALEQGGEARTARLEDAVRDGKEKASVAWRGLLGDLEKCTQLPIAERGSCISATELWLSQARSMFVSLPAGKELIETSCGVMQPSFGADWRTVVAEEVGDAEVMLGRLKSPDMVAAATAARGTEGNQRFDRGRLKVPAGGAGSEMAMVEVGPSEADSADVAASNVGPGKIGIEWIDLGRFSISKSEVTVGQYRKCVDAGACTTPTGRSSSEYCNWGHSGREDHPVNCVDWFQASAFAKWAGARLPTGEEWTYAATSGGKSWDHPWGDEEATCSRAIMDDGGGGCGEYRTWPVCSKPAGNSTQGVCDLAGNVWEWTDEIEGNAYRVYRGSGWNNAASFLGAAGRSGSGPSSRTSNHGFRLAR